MKKLILAFCFVIAFGYAQTIHFDTPLEINDGDFSEAIASLRTLTRGDIAILHINTYGGSVYETLRMVAALQSCRATVITVAEGYVFSCGTILLASGKRMVIKNTSLLLFHRVYIDTEFGKYYNEITDKLSEISFDLFKDLLTDEQEIDFWLGEDVVIKGSELR